MVPPKKPDWFELTDGEGHNRPNRRKKFVKVAALTAPLVIVAAGVVLAQTGESGSADAVSNSPAPVVATETVTPTTPDAAAPVAKAPAVAPAKSSTFVKKPAIANPPTRRGGDDDDEWGEHDGRERHHDDDEGEWEDE